MSDKKRMRSGKQKGSKVDEESSSASDDDWDDSSSSASSSKGYSEGDDDDDNEEIDVVFEFFDVKEGDFHDIRSLLKNLVDAKHPVQLGELADAVIAQNQGYGSMIKINEGEDTMGMIAAVNLSSKQKQPEHVAQQLQQFVRDSLPQAGPKSGKSSGKSKRSNTAPGSSLVPSPEQLESVWRSNVALLLNERLLNVPMALVEPLHRMFHSELAQAKQPPIDQFLLITRAYYEEEGGEDEPAKEQASKKKRPAAAAAAAAAAVSAPKLMFYKPEEEAYYNLATWRWTVPMAVAAEQAGPRWTFQGRVRDFRLFMLVDRAQFAHLNQEINKIII